MSSNIKHIIKLIGGINFFGRVGFATTITTVETAQTKERNATQSTKHALQKNSHVKTSNASGTNTAAMVKMIVEIIRMKLAAVRILLYVFFQHSQCKQKLVAGQHVDCIGLAETL